MSEAPKPKIQDESGLPWGKFFHQELLNLKIRTQLLQWEKFCERGEDGKQEARQLIAEMVVECKRHPYDRIKKEVIQRVIHSAIVDDKDFTGFSVKWIRHTLNNWWMLYGDKILREMQRIADEEEERKKPTPTVNPHEDVHQTVNNYVNALKSNPMPKMSPKEYTLKGAEWKSDLEFISKDGKRTGYQNPHTVEYYRMKELIHRAASEHYKGCLDFSKFDVYLINDYQVFAANEKEAMEIYLKAEKLFKSNNNGK